MATVTKKELVEQIARATGRKQVDVKQVVQVFLDEVIVELGKGNRLEFRDFGIFEVAYRKPRRAHNPATLAPVEVPAKRMIKFKAGRLMRETIESPRNLLGDPSVDP